MEQSDTLVCELHSQSRISATPNAEETTVRRTLRMGVLFCLTATVFYSFSTVCFKELLAVGQDYRWILFMKEMTCVVCIMPVIIYWAIRRRYHWPTLKWVIIILIGGFVCEYIGARLHFWAVGMIGLIVTIPLIQTANLTCSAGIGRLFLGERIGIYCRIAMVVMLVAMCCLVFGTVEQDKTEKSVGTPVAEVQANTSFPIVGDSLLLCGIGAVVAGMAYAVYIVMLRYTSKSRQMPITLIAVNVTGVGAVIFGMEFLRAHEYQIAAFWENVPPRVWLLTTVVGLLNMVGFLFQIIGLRYTVVARAQMISVAQICVCTLFGVFVFRENTNLMIWLGVALTVLGIYIVSTPDKKEGSIPVLG